VHGRNELPEKHVPSWMVFLLQMKAPMPIMIWCATYMFHCAHACAYPANPCPTNIAANTLSLGSMECLWPKLLPNSAGSTLISVSCPSCELDSLAPYCSLTNSQSLLEEGAMMVCSSRLEAGVAAMGLLPAGRPTVQPALSCRIAIIIELGIKNWVDAGILLGIQLANATIGWYETMKSGHAVEALKKSLKPEATVKRDGKFQTINAALLVPGDLVLLGSGSAVPADCMVNEGRIEIDQAALTGMTPPTPSHFAASVCTAVKPQ
jgi:hypothetical protein